MHALECCSVAFVKLLQWEKPHLVSEHTLQQLWAKELWTKDTSLTADVVKRYRMNMAGAK